MSLAVRIVNEVTGKRFPTQLFTQVKPALYTQQNLEALFRHHSKKQQHASALQARARSSGRLLPTPGDHQVDALIDL